MTFWESSERESSSQRRSNAISADSCLGTQGLEFSVSSFGFWVLSFGSRVSGSEFWVSGFISADSCLMIQAFGVCPRWRDYGTYKTVKARFWHRFFGGKIVEIPSCFLFARQRPPVVPPTVHPAPCTLHPKLFGFTLNRVVQPPVERRLLRSILLQHSGFQVLGFGFRGFLTPYHQEQ